MYRIKSARTIKANAISPEPFQITCWGGFGWNPGTSPLLSSPNPTYRPTGALDRIERSHANDWKAKARSNLKVYSN